MDWKDRANEKLEQQLKDLHRTTEVELRVEIVRQEIKEIKRKLHGQHSESQVQLHRQNNHHYMKLGSLQAELAFYEPRVAAVIEYRESKIRFIEGMMTLSRTARFPTDLLANLKRLDRATEKCELWNIHAQKSFLMRRWSSASWPARRALIRQFIVPLPFSCARIVCRRGLSLGLRTFVISARAAVGIFRR